MKHRSTFLSFAFKMNLNKRYNCILAGLDIDKKKRKYVLHDDRTNIRPDGGYELRPNDAAISIDFGKTMSLKKLLPVAFKLLGSLNDYMPKLATGDFTANIDGYTLNCTLKK